MRTIASFRVKIHKTTDTKKLKEGKKVYSYGAINIRAPELAKYVGRVVSIKVVEEP